MNIGWALLMKAFRRYVLPNVVLGATALVWLGSIARATAAAGFDTRAIAFVNLYRDTCMNHLNKPAALRSDLEGQGWRPVSSQYASFFLQGKPGRTWAMAKSGGNFVVALRDDGICAVFARSAKQNDVELFFNALVRSTEAAGLPTERRPDKVLQTPNGPVRYTSYVQGKPESTVRISLVLSTTSSTTASIQAMATLSLVRAARPQ